MYNFDIEDDVQTLVRDDLTDKMVLKMFFGSHTKRCEEVGNAVPPALSSAIAKSIKEVLDEYYGKKSK